MNCRESAALVSGLARGQLFEASLREEALTHTRRCSRCAATLVEQSAVAAAVRAAAEDVSARGASAHVEEALRAAFREQHRGAGAVSQPIGVWRRPRWWAAASAAAILLLACTVGLLRQKSPRIDVAGAAQSAAPASAHAAAQDGATTLRASSAHVEGVPERPAARRRTPRRSRAAHRVAAVETEATTEFFLLTDDAQHVPLESGQVVRVELPLSSLVPAEASAGDETARRMVKADLLIGQDGLARAIRFVR